MMATSTETITIEKFSIYLSAFESHIKSLSELTSFADVVDWETNASSFISNLLILKLQFEDKIVELHNEMIKATHDHDALPLLKKLFTPNDRHRGLQSAIDNHQNSIMTIDKMVEKLTALIELTPNSISEKKEFIAEYRVIKKELQLQKREVVQAMREARLDARSSLSEIGSTRAMFIGGMNRFQKASIRMRRDNTLTDQVDIKTSIDKRILEIDKEILRITKIF